MVPIDQIDMSRPATCGELGAPAGRADRIIRPLGPGSDAAVLKLLHRCGQSSRSPTAGQILFDRILRSKPPSAAWTIGLFVANELTGVAGVAATPPEAHFEAMLFVDSKWRRQGIGSMLLKEAMNWASCGEASSLRLICDRTDWPMRRLAEKFGARLDLVFGQMIADINLVKQ
jgi:GNAT superfamily N-acetyltransferase